MKKLYILIVLGAVAMWTLNACGEKKAADKKEGEDEEYSDYETAQPKKDTDEDLIKQGQALVEASDCKTCHHAVNKLVGPPHTDVAKKYEFTRANVGLLAGKIIKGGSGVWGDIPMTPHADVAQADAEKMAMYVLSLDGEKPKD
jgi:cytochrome c